MRRWSLGLLALVAWAAVPTSSGCVVEKLNPVAGGGGGADGGSGGQPVTYRDPFSVQLFDRTRIESHSDLDNFQNAITEASLGEGPFASATLIVDLDSTCYPFESWADNPPPAGEKWPADCDAFDRNFEWTLDDPESDSDPPGIELVRAITPFGGPLHLEIDITDVANGIDEGMHRFRAHITTWSDGAGIVSGSNGGWFVSGRIDVTPGPAPREVLAVIPIYNKSYGPDDIPGPQTFVVPEGTVASRLEYRVTGHGGGNGGFSCVGPAEEFCNREHRLAFDGVDYAAFYPWRTDCADLCTLTTYTNANGGGFNYCLENPCGAVQSVQAPRANWCPGDVSPPIIFEPGLAAGEHSITWGVSAIAEGGSWRTSVTYFAFGAP